MVGIGWRMKRLPSFRRQAAPTSLPPLPLFMHAMFVLLLTQRFSLPTFLYSPFCPSPQIDSPPGTLIRAKYDISPSALDLSSPPPNESIGKMYVKLDPSPPQTKGNSQDGRNSLSNAAQSIANSFSSKKKSGADRLKQDPITTNINEIDLKPSTLNSNMSFKIPPNNNGIHQLCIQILGASQKNPAQVSLIIQEGKPEASYYTEGEATAIKSTFSNLRVQSSILIDEMEGVLNEADYVKQKEIIFHDSSRGVHESSRWWPIIQVAVMVIVGGYQVWHLEGFFKKRKLV